MKEKESFVFDSSTHGPLQGLELFRREMLWRQ